MRIIKRNQRGEPVWEYPGKLLEQSKTAYLFEAFFNRNDLIFNGVLLKEGDRFLELYPLGAWFNIYQIHDVENDAVKAWYCNVTRPVVVEGDTLSYDDLALDLLVYPDREMLVLDEDEFLTLSISNDERRKARAGLEQLKSIFSQGEAFSIENYQCFFPSSGDRK